MKGLHTLFRLLAAWVCLAIQVAVASPLPTLLTAGVAAWDGEHDVELGIGQDRFRVVLGHRSLPVVPAHEHCGCCRFLVSMSRDAAQGDHVVEFSSIGTELRRDSRNPVATLRFLPQPAEPVRVRILELPTAVSSRPSVPAESWAAPILPVALVSTDASLRI